MHKSIKFLGALAVAGLIAAGGSAYTASNTVVASVAGYGTSTVSGAATSSVVHTLSADGATIISTVITFTTTQQGRTVTAGFGAAALQSCTVDPLVELVDPKTATCTYGTAYVTDTETSFNVAVTE